MMDTKIKEKMKKKNNFLKGTCSEKMSKIPLEISKDCNRIELRKGKRFFSLYLIYCVLPNGYEGYRLEYVCDNKGSSYPEYLGTVIFDNKSKKWKIINW